MPLEDRSRLVVVDPGGPIRSSHPMPSTTNRSSMACDSVWHLLVLVCTISCTLVNHRTEEMKRRAELDSNPCCVEAQTKPCLRVIKTRSSVCISDFWLWCVYLFHAENSGGKMLYLWSACNGDRCWVAWGNIFLSCVVLQDWNLQTSADNWKFR